MADELGFKIKGAASDPIEVCAFNTRTARHHQSRRRVTKTTARNPDPEEFARRLEKALLQQAANKPKASEAAPDSTSYAKEESTASDSHEPSSKEVCLKQHAYSEACNHWLL